MSLEDSKWWANIHGVEKHETKTKKVDVYYEKIQKLAHVYKYQPHTIFSSNHQHV